MLDSYSVQALSTMFQEPGTLTQSTLSSEDDGLYTSTESATDSGTAAIYVTGCCTFPYPYAGMAETTESLPFSQTGTETTSDRAFQYSWIEVNDPFESESFSVWDGGSATNSASDTTTDATAPLTTTETGTNTTSTTVTSGGSITTSSSGTINGEPYDDEFMGGASPSSPLALWSGSGSGFLSAPLSASSGASYDPSSLSPISPPYPGLGVPDAGFLWNSVGSLRPREAYQRPDGLPSQGPYPDGVSRSAPPTPTSTLIALAAAGRNPTDITLPTAGTEAVDPPPGSHLEPGAVPYVEGELPMSLRPALWGPGATSNTAPFTGGLLRPSMDTVTYDPFGTLRPAPTSSAGPEGLAAGFVQGAANVGNSVTDAGIGVVNLVPLAYNNTVGYVPGVRPLRYIEPPEWSAGFVNVDGVPIEDAETHRHSRFAGTIAVAAGSALLGPAIPLPKVPLPAPLLATGSGSMAVATTFEVSARLGTVGTLGAINQAGLGAQTVQMAAGNAGGNAPGTVDPNIEPTFGENFGSKIKTKLNQLRKKYPEVRDAKGGGIEDALAIAQQRVAQGGGRVGPPVGQGETAAIYFEDGPVTWVFRPNGEFWSMRGEFRMDAMNPRNPHTWDDLASHPALEKGSFDPSWYDGDVKEDLRRLRDATLTILESFPNWSCELVRDSMIVRCM